MRAPPGAGWHGSGSGSPAGPSYGVAPTFVPAQRGSSGWSLGCGIAGCLGTLLLIGLVVGALFFVGGRSAPNGGGKSSATGGSLRSRLPQRVGAWSLQSVKPMNVASANEAYIAAYGKGGEKMVVGLSAFSSSDTAESHLQAMFGSVRKAANGAHETKITIRGENRKVTGHGRSWASNPERFVYRTGRMTGLMVGPPGQIKSFFQKF